MTVDQDTLEAAVHAWVVACSGLTEQQIQWTGQPKAARPPEPAIMLKWYVSDNIGVPWVDSEDNPLVLTTKTITGVAGNVLTCAAHGLLSGDGPVRLSSTLLVPAPLAEDTDYWVIRLTDSTFSLAATYTHTGGNVVGNPITPITLTDAGTGTITLNSTVDTVRAGEEINYLARGQVRVGLQLFCHTSTAVSMGAAMAVLRKVAQRAYLPSCQEILAEVNIGLNGFERVRPLLGDKDAVLFQPRAWVDVHMNMPFEESEPGTIIARVTGERFVPPDAAAQPFEIPDPD